MLIQPGVVAAHRVEIAHVSLELLEAAKLDGPSHLCPLTPDMFALLGFGTVFPHYAPIPPYRKVIGIPCHCVLELCNSLLDFARHYS